MSYYQDSNPRRQKMIKTVVKSEAESAIIPLIDSYEKLEENLQGALKVEHFTIPPYLSALYSIKEGTNDEAIAIIRTVAVEEMLHMVLVANLMNALGMTPRINGQSLIANYPEPIPNGSPDFVVSLLKFSKESINTFLRIEKPAKKGAKPEVNNFHSIGQFYEAIRESLEWLEREENKKSKTLFTGDKTKQVGPEHYYGSGGNLIKIHTLDDANAALDEIVGQGEGIDGSINVPLNEGEEFAHYFRFNQIFYERKYKQGDEASEPPSGLPLQVDWNDVYNMEPNPKMDKYREYPWLLEKVTTFNKTYMRLLDNLHKACSGTPNALKEEGIPLMYQLKTQAVELMKIPSGNGNYTAGPTFEYVP
jgi:hypothetical protein